MALDFEDDLFERLQREGLVGFSRAPKSNRKLATKKDEILPYIFESGRPVWGLEGKILHHLVNDEISPSDLRRHTIGAKPDAMTLRAFNDALDEVRRSLLPAEGYILKEQLAQDSKRGRVVALSAVLREDFVPDNPQPASGPIVSKKIETVEEKSRREFEEYWEQYGNPKAYGAKWVIEFLMSNGSAPKSFEEVMRYRFEGNNDPQVSTWTQEALKSAIKLASKTPQGIVDMRFTDKRGYRRLSDRWYAVTQGESKVVIRDDRPAKPLVELPTATHDASDIVEVIINGQVVRKSRRDFEFVVLGPTLQESKPVVEKQVASNTQDKTNDAINEWLEAARKQIPADKPLKIGALATIVGINVGEITRLEGKIRINPDGTVPADDAIKFFVLQKGRFTPTKRTMRALNAAIK
jgi:hypothetical protein